MYRVAKERGGQCLSVEYKNGTTPLLWECSEGHQWKTPYLGVINTGAWCPECGLKKLSDPRKYSIEDLHKLAAKNGGKCLSKKYTHIMHRYLFECTKGHQWTTPANSVLNGTWCPECGRHARYTEKKCRNILEDLTGLKFSSTRRVLPNRYELDMYNEQFKLAFEYDGEQHSIYPSFWHKTKDDFKKQQNRDKFKDEICLKLGITLERISYRIARKGTAFLTDFLRDRLLKNQVRLSSVV